MKDDFSNVDSASCYILANPTTIYGYSSGVRTTYYQVGGKWYKSAVSDYYSLPSNSYCYTELNFSSNSQYEPIFHFIAFCLVAVAVYCFFYVLRKAFYALKVD